MTLIPICRNRTAWQWWTWMQMVTLMLPPVLFGDKIVIWYENDGQGNFTSHLIGENQEAYDIRIG